MSNVFEDVDVFRLVDVDGVSITAGTYIEIHIPEGFGESDIILERSKDHGLDFDFFDDESNVIFDGVVRDGETQSGKDLIDAIYAVNGTDSRILFQYLRGSTPVLVNEWNLILSLSTRIDYGWSVHMERLDFDGDFVNRRDTKFDLKRTTNLNGGAYTAPTAQTMIQFSQPVSRKMTIAANQTEGSTTAADTKRAILNLGSVGESNFKEDFVEMENDVDPTDAVEDTPRLTANSYGLYSFYADTLQIEYRISTGATGSLKLRVDLIHPEQKYGAYDPVYGVNIHTLGSPTIGSTATWTISSQSALTNWANKGYSFAIYLWFDGSGGGFEYMRVKASDFRIEALVSTPIIESKYYDLETAINKTLEGITGQASSLDSDFLALQTVGILNGRMLRGDAAPDHVYMNWKDTSESLSAIFGLGSAVIDNSGTFKVTVEPHNDFYADSEIIAFTSEVSDFEISPDSKMLFNELEIGYKNFAKGSDTAILAETNQDFLTRHNYLSPIRRDKNKKTILSPWTASGQVMEEGKQQPVSLFPDEKWKHDEDIFLMSLYDTQNKFYNMGVEIWQFDLATDQYAIVLPFYWPDSMWVPTLGDQITIPTHGTVTIGMRSGSGYVPTDFVNHSAVWERHLEANKTWLFIEEDLSLGGGSAVGSITDDVLGTVTLEDESWVSPESNEAFSTFSGVTDVNAVFNARYHIKNMLFANSLILNSALEFFANTEEYQLMSFENNADLQTRFDVAEDYSTLDPNRETVTQSDDIQIVDVNQGNNLFIPEILKFDIIRIGFTDIMTIIDAHKEQIGVGSNYGYISVTAYNGTTYKGFLRTMKYNPLTETASFELIRKK